jgi:hypothetical protein
MTDAADQFYVNHTYPTFFFLSTLLFIVACAAANLLQNDGSITI